MTPEVRLRVIHKVLEGSVDPNAWGCALARCADPGVMLNLVLVGQSLGLTKSESVGVMDGWDSAAGTLAVFAKRVRNGEHIFAGMAEPFVADLTEYQAGFDLGQHVFREVQALREAQAIP